MNKLFTKIATACVGLAMAVGVGVAVSNNKDSVPVYAGTSSFTVQFKKTEATNPSNKITTSTTESNYVDSGANYVALSSSSNLYEPGVGGLKIGGSSAAGEAVFSLDKTYTIKKITLNCASYNGGSTKRATFTVKAGTTAASATFTPTSTSLEEHDFEFTNSVSTSTISIGTNKYGWFDKIVVTYDDGGVVYTAESLRIEDESTITKDYFEGESWDNTSFNVQLVKGGNDNPKTYQYEDLTENLSFVYKDSLSNVLQNPITAENVTLTITSSVYTDLPAFVSSPFNVTVSAFNGYAKVTQMSDLTIGDTYVVASPENDALMGTIAGGTKYYMNSIDAEGSFLSSKTKVSATLPTGTIEITLLYAGESAFYMYDLTDSKYLQFAAGDSKNYLKDNISEATVLDASFTDGQINLDVNGSNPTRCLGYNKSSPRFTSYGNTSTYNTVALYKKIGSSLKTTVTTWTNTYLKMNDPAYEGDITTDSCDANYAALKNHYNDLTDAEKNVLQYSGDYSAARARMDKWAEAHHETFTYGAATPFTGAIILSISSIAEKENTVSVIVIIAIASLIAIGGYFFIRKRKEQ